MSRLFIILVPLLLALTSFDEPCQKKITKSDGSYILLYFPSCKDSLTYLARTYEKGILVNETWAQHGKPAGLEINYSIDRNNPVSSVSYWDKGDVASHTSYFNGTNKPQKFSQKINDSTFYEIEYYWNGNIKSHGLATRQHCCFGTWIEPDSLGSTKWTGKYKLVQKEERERFEHGTVIQTWCFEKEGTWIKTDSRDQVLGEKNIHRRKS